MKKWKKQEALEALSELIKQLEVVRQNGRKSQEHMRWVANALRVLEEIFGRSSRYYQTLLKILQRISSIKLFQGWRILLARM